MKAMNYQAVQNFPILEAYLQHFSRISMKNEIPGLLSFFFIQGQVLLPYVRIPTGDSHLDSRVHVFWIQPSRTGKSIAWEFIGDIMKSIGVPYEMFSSGTDAGLIGSVQSILDENNKPTNELETIPGLLAGRKGINFDEGSILLNPNKHSQETVLYLQTACNAIGSGGNVLVKHMKGTKVECESLVSLWITTYPPKGVKDYVLTKGIFQRVLLYWSHWDMDMRQEVSNRRLGTFLKKSNHLDLTRDDMVDYFKDTEKRVRDRLLNMSETSYTEWSEMGREGQEDIAQQYMWDMFTAGPNYSTALFQASDEIYGKLNNMKAGMSEIVASFTPAIENYIGIFSVHFAVLDEKWEVTDKHVDMSKEILLDLFDNMISWLEDSVEIGSNKAKETKIMDGLVEAFNTCTEYELENHGDGWRRMSAMRSQYMNTTGVSSSTADRHFKDYKTKLFKSRKSGTRVFLKRIGTK